MIAWFDGKLCGYEVVRNIAVGSRKWKKRMLNVIDVCELR